MVNDVSTVVDVDVVAGGCVVVEGVTDVEVATELLVLPPLMRLLLHDASSAQIPNATMSGRIFIREVCQR